MNISNITKYIGNNVKRKNLRGGYKYYFVLAYSDLFGFKLYEEKTQSRFNVASELFQHQFKILK